MNIFIFKTNYKKTISFFRLELYRKHDRMVKQQCNRQQSHLFKRIIIVRQRVFMINRYPQL